MGPRDGDRNEQAQPVAWVGVRRTQAEHPGLLLGGWKGLGAAGGQCRRASPICTYRKPEIETWESSICISNPGNFLKIL